MVGRLVDSVRGTADVDGQRSVKKRSTVFQGRANEPLQDFLYLLIAVVIVVAEFKFVLAGQNNDFPGSSGGISVIVVIIAAGGTKHQALNILVRDGDIPRVYGQ